MFTNILKLNKGFTMLELLMVIIVVGLLASLAIPQYQGFVEKAKISEATSMLGAIASAQEVFKLEHGRYANGIVELESAGFNAPGDHYWYSYDTYDSMGDGQVCYAYCYRNPSVSCPAGVENTMIELDIDNTGAWYGTPGQYWYSDHPNGPNSF